MSVAIPFPADGTEERQEPPSETYRLDMDAGRIFGKTDGLEAVNQAIRKALITPRFACLAYDRQYGSEIHTLLRAQDITPEYIMSELPELIEEALLADSRILAAYDFAFAFDGDRCKIHFKADTIFGTATIEEDF